jgi:hypothetical protein
MNNMGQGYVTFIRRIEGKPEPETKKVNSEWTYSGFLGSSYRIRDLEEVLEGHYSFLCDAFIWDNTPQGNTHWDQRYTGAEPMSEEDYDYVRWLYDNRETYMRN